MEINRQVARGLLSIGAVFLRPQEPFTWASGIKSPIYCDNRLILTAPEVRELVENAIDAGASAIVLEVQHGGLTYLRITDNGCGMTAEELEAALKEIITETGATSGKDMGKVMGVASKKLAGLAEGRAISAKVKELLG